MVIRIILFIGSLISYILYKICLSNKTKIFINIDGEMFKYTIYSGTFVATIKGKRFEICKEDNWNYRYGDSEEWRQFKENEEINCGDFIFSIKCRTSIIWIRNLIATFVAALIISPILYVLWGMDIESNPSIIATNEDSFQNNYNSESNHIGQSNVDENDYNELEHTGSEILSIVKVEGGSVVYKRYVVETSISNNTLFMGANNVAYSAETMIERTFCLSYSDESGNDCFFVGQFNDNYHWDGICSICAYRDGKLVYITVDTYNDGIIKAYKRISSKKNTEGWVYSDKQIDMDNRYFGDTRNYSYVEIAAKDYSMDNPTIADLYSLNEVISLISNGIINHYYGYYDYDQNWDDNTGDAYCIKYVDGVVTEIFKGVFYKNHYGEGMLIIPRGDGDFEVTIGEFHDKNGNSINNKLKTRMLTSDEVRIIIHGEKYEDEVEMIF